MRFPNLLLAACAIPAVSTSLACSAATAAQPVEPTPNEDVTDNPEQETGRADLDPANQVIIVTARKREEALEDVPAAITALTDERIELEGIRTIEEVVLRSPGVTFATIGAPFADQITIRGQGAARQINAEPATGIYRNGAFVVGGNVGGGNLSRLDLFDVERVEVYRGPQGALFGRNAVGGAINVISARPVNDFTGFVEAGYGENERFEARAVGNAPLGDGVFARIGALYVSQAQGFFFNPLLNEFSDEEEAMGARLGLRIEPSNRTFINVTLDYFDENTGSLAVGTFNPTIPGVNPFVEPMNTRSRFDREEYTAILEVSHEMDFATLSSLSFLKSRDAFTVDDLDAFLNVTIPAFSNLVRFNSDDFTRWGQDLRLHSDVNQRLTWLIGAEILRLENTSVLEFSGNPVRFQNSISETRSEDWSLAIYGLLGYDITDEINLTGEARYSRDDKDFDLRFTSFNSMGVPTVTNRSLAETFEKFAPVVTLSYSPRDPLLFYARFATGFRAGGFNNRPDPRTPERFDLPYDQESARSYELGAKLGLADRRVQANFAAFLVDTNGVLVTQTVVDGVTLINFVDNLGESQIHGLEGELSVRVPLNQQGADLRFFLAASWNEGEFTDGPFDGFALPFVRDWEASASTLLNVPLSDNLALFATHSFRGQWGGWEDEPTNRPLDDITLHDVRVGLVHERWSLIGEVQNLFDELYVVQQLTPAVHKISQPRRWMLRFRFRF